MIELHNRHNTNTLKQSTRNRVVVMKTFLNILCIFVSPAMMFPLYLSLPWCILGTCIISLYATRPCLHSENHKPDEVRSFKAINFQYNIWMLREFPITVDMDQKIPAFLFHNTNGEICWCGKVGISICCSGS